MPLNDMERRALQEIKDWESKMSLDAPNDIQFVFENYLEQSFLLLPEGVRKQFFGLMDNMLFHLQATIQGSQLQADVKERILATARVMDPSVEAVNDLKKMDLNRLQFIAQQQISRHRFYSFAQGGLAGSGSKLMLGIDLPAMAVINLRAIQLIALSYGYETNTPFEMMSSLRIFHVSTLPKRNQHEGWKLLMNDFAESKERYFFEGSEEVTDSTWIEQPLLQMLKASVIYLWSKKSAKKLPVLSMAVGAGLNYGFTRKVTQYANYYYMLRYLKQKEEIE